MILENTYFLLLNLCQLIVVFLLFKWNRESFKVQLHYQAKPILLTFFIVLFLDIIFTQNNLWEYNSQFSIGIFLLGVPIEKIVQILAVLTSTLLTFMWIKKHINFRFKTGLIRVLFVLLLALYLPMSYIHWYDWHTLLASIIFNVSLIYLFVFTPKWNSSFLFTFWTIGIPYTFLQLIVSGYFFDTVIFKYNSLETQGFFVVGFPLEELMYLFGVLLFGVFLLEKLNPDLLSK